MAKFCMAILYCEKPLHHWSYALKSSFTKSWNRITVKFWSQCLQYLQNNLEIFMHHLAFAVPLLETDNISPICQYIINVWTALMTCTLKNRDLLVASSDKISIFNLGQTEHCSARGDGPRCAQHRALISFLWCSPTQRTRETELNRLNHRDFPLHTLSFAWWVPHVQVAFSSEPSRNLLCATILDIISTSRAYVLSLRRARSPPPHAAQDPARAAADPSTFWWFTSQWVSFRATGFSY